MSVALSRSLFALLLASTAACASSAAAGGGVPRSTSDVDRDTVPDVDDHCPYDQGSGSDGCPVATPAAGGASTIETSVTPDPVVPAAPPVPAPGPTTPPAAAPIPATAPR